MPLIGRIVFFFFYFVLFSTDTGKLHIVFVSMFLNYVCVYVDTNLFILITHMQ